MLFFNIDDLNQSSFDAPRMNGSKSNSSARHRGKQVVQKKQQLSRFLDGMVYSGFIGSPLLELRVIFVACEEEPPSNEDRTVRLENLSVFIKLSATEGTHHNKRTSFSQPSSCG